MKRDRRTKFLRVEVHSSLRGPGWSWRVTEPRPGRTAIIRRHGHSRSWWVATLRAVIELRKLWGQA